jgi:hypothetical protein
MTALVIVEVIHKHSVRSIEHEHYAPVAIDGDGPMTFQVALEGVQSPCWRREVFGLDRLIKSRQLKTHPCRVRNLNACLAAGFEKALQALVSEGLDHFWLIVVCSAVRYNLIKKPHPSR